MCGLLGRHLLFQSQLLKHQQNLCNLFKVNNKDTSQWRRSDVFIINSEHISHIVLAFPSFTLNKYMSAGAPKISKGSVIL